MKKFSIPFIKELLINLSLVLLVMAVLIFSTYAIIHMGVIFGIFLGFIVVVLILATLDCK